MPRPVLLTRTPAPACSPRRRPGSTGTGAGARRTPRSRRMTVLLCPFPLRGPRKFHGYRSLKEYYEEESCMRYLHRVSGGPAGRGWGAHLGPEHPPGPPCPGLSRGLAHSAPADHPGLLWNQPWPSRPPCANPGAACPLAHAGPGCSCVCAGALQTPVVPWSPLGPGPLPGPALVPHRQSGGISQSWTLVGRGVFHYC